MRGERRHCFFLIVILIVIVIPRRGSTARSAASRGSKRDGKPEACATPARRALRKQSVSAPRGRR